MQRSCDICGGAAERIERIVENGKAVEYAYCEACYSRAVKSGVLPHEEAKRRLARRGRECPVCGYTAEYFEKTMLFGCPDCYRTMRAFASDAIMRTQGSENIFIQRAPLPKAQKKTKDGFKTADECSADDLVKDNVVSSRLRFARNVNGLEFPHMLRNKDVRAAALLKGAEMAAKGVFEAGVHTMAGLSDVQKKVLLERHFISLPLANNNQNGAVIIEKGKRPQMSIMVFEEDHIREQCVVDGHALGVAYARLKSYDAQLARQFEIAYDRQFGYLTACPTNVGTGMRASEMLFLPALRRTGAIDDALKTIKEAYGLAVRGYFGEGSEFAYDMYQISNSRTFGMSETDTIKQIEQAVIKLCYCERVALERLVSEENSAMFNDIGRSYGILTNAYTLTSQELMKLVVDVKLGVILGILPIKSTGVLNRIIEECSSSLEISNKDIGVAERDKIRAQIVRRILAEDK